MASNSMNAWFDLIKVVLGIVPWIYVCIIATQMSEIKRENQEKMKDMGYFERYRFLRKEWKKMKQRKKQERRERRGK